MKFVFVPILLLLVLIQTFSKWVILADYELNKEYIAKVLCENRKRPMLHCNGKCQLTKKLAAEEADARKSASNSTNAKVQFSETLFDDCIIALDVMKITTKKKGYSTGSLVFIPSRSLTQVFHPPLV